MRAALYARVSSEEQVEGFSLDAQNRGNMDFCKAKGWTVVEEYVDQGKSARGDDLAKRPAFQKMMNDVSSGRLDVVVVHKLDRFARNIRVTFEQFQILDRNNVLFASVSEQGLDFTTPIGKVLLSVLAGLAQYFSDNLSQEVKKGKRERKAQGFYNGLLPFGVKKNSSGIPVPDPETYPGLLLAFNESAKGNSDREVANSLNNAGYRTTGNRGHNPFTKDTVCAMLQNRFYLGELPSNEDGWIQGVHDPLLDDGLFAAATESRQRRFTTPLPVRRQAAIHSLSGMLRCFHCGGKLHIHREKGRARAYCYQGRQGAKCPQRSTFLDVYEDQLFEHLTSFTIPEDYRPRLLSLQGETKISTSDVGKRRQRIEKQLANIKVLFSLGDMSKGEYLQQRKSLQDDLRGLRSDDEVDDALERAATFLGDVSAAWIASTDEQKNSLARLMYEEIHVKDSWVVAVKPQPSFSPFFDLDCQVRRLSSGSDGIRTRGLSLDRAAC